MNALARCALRHDALLALSAASSRLPSAGRLRTVDYRASANAAAANAQSILRAIDGGPDAIADARSANARSLRGLDVAVRFGLALRGTGDVFNGRALCEVA